MYKNPTIHWYHGRIQDRVALISCDSEYFLTHAPAYIQSARNISMRVHLHLINPNIAAKSLLDKFRADDISISYEEDSPGDRVYYACNRFIVASILLSQTLVEEMFITDIDALWMKNPISPVESVGLFTRDPLPGTIGWEAEGTKVAAGIVYVRNSQEARVYLDRVAEYIMYEKTPAWFLDQIALHASLRYLKEYHRFDSNFMDWEFREGTVMWTGKGDRKHTNQTYLAMKKKYAEMFS